MQKLPKIKASYVTTDCIMMGCMESNWMTQTEQQMEKNSFGNIFAYNCNALNPFQGFNKEISFVVTVELRASTGFCVGSSFITH
jgi:hypothetical protein